MDSGAAELMKLYTMAGPWVYQSLYVAAELDLASHLGDDPTPVAELAQRTGAHEGALYRFCRVLAGLGVLSEDGPRTFTATPMGQALRLEPVRAVINVLNGESFRVWADVMHTVRTGKPAFDEVFGKPYYEYLKATPRSRAVLDNALNMGELPPPFLDLIGFDRSQVVVDVGGGAGSMLAAVLRRYPAVRGVLLDLPEAVADADRHLTDQGVADRCEIVPGSFFDVMPQGADTYVLARVLYNWSDQDAVRLLGNIRSAIASEGRLLVVEPIMPPRGVFSPALLLDLHMLLMVGGEFRTEEELRILLAESGFTVQRAVLPPGAEAPGAVPIAVEAVCG